MSVPKLHHHLPQSYQQGFCLEGRLWVFDRVTGKFRRDQPKNIAAITNDYTIYRDGGTKDTRVEKFFAQLDGAGVPIIRKLRTRELLSGDERLTFSWYLAFLVARVPRFKRWINEHETARRKLFDREHLKSPRQLQDVIDRSGLPDDVRAEADANLMFEMLTSEEYAVSVGHNYGVRLLMEAGIDLMPRIHDLCWLVCHASEESQFIASDNPVVEDPSGRMVACPIASDTALMMMPSPSDKLFNYDKDTPSDIVHLTNVATAKASERLVLARDEDYLRRVVREAGIEGEPPAEFVDIGPPPTR
jgi:uncharacterized protein DUF4238